MTAAEQPARGVVAHLFVPCLLGLALTPYLSTSKPHPAMTALVLMLAMLFIWLAEQVSPREASWNARPLRDGLQGFKRLGHDAVYLLGVTQLTAFLIGAVDAPLRAGVARVGIGPLGLWPTSAPFWALSRLVSLNT